MIIDRYFDPDLNALILGASMIAQLKNSGESDITVFLKEIENKFPGTSDNYAFDGLGLLFLVGKIRLDTSKDTIGLNDEAYKP